MAVLPNREPAKVTVTEGLIPAKPVQ